MSAAPVQDGRRRAVIETVTPCVDGGAWPIKRTLGEEVVVQADIFTDGHDQLRCLLRYRSERETDWHEVPMKPLANDRWQGRFTVTELSGYRYTVCAWVDRFLTWRHDLLRRVDDEDIALALLSGVELIEAAAGRAGGDEAAQLAHWAEELASGDSDLDMRRKLAASEALDAMMTRHADRSLMVEYPGALAVSVDVERARFGSWYELFPRSCVNDPAEHGTLASCQARLEYVAEMGFDVVYLPPIHPIGRKRRKGPNNTLTAGSADPGSPWAIGTAEGGHKSVHPRLGTLKDFRRFVQRAEELGLSVALDIAFQCAPDHPYVSEHPQWFRYRPDGSMQYAENPPKKYQDIYPFNFETDDWQALWEELRSVFTFWIEQGVNIFRVDNPHTKPFAFWQWLIAEIRREHPETIFLSEAFTRGKVMHRLAKVGFTQSYTYFTWRNTREELTQYARELCQSPSREYFLPNLWPNTPDILPQYLQYGGRAAFMVRLVLAATMGANYGIYGPAFELLENRPLEHGSEEYLESEKYQVRTWDLDRPDSLRHLVARLNRIRRDNPALQHDWSLVFHPIDNDMLIAYSKSTRNPDNVVIMIANLDPHYRQSGWVDLPAELFGMPGGRGGQMHDLLTDARFLWNVGRNYVELDPGQAHVMRLRRAQRTEQDFDYFM